MRLYFLVTCCLLFTRSLSQTTDSTVIRLTQIKYFDSVHKQCFMVAIEKNTVQTKEIPSLPYPDTPMRQGSVPDSIIEMDCFVRFTLYNDADTTREVYFVPAYYIKSLEVYTASPNDIPGSFRQVDADTLNIRFFNTCRLITVKPRDTLMCYARFTLVRSNVNTYFPRIIEKDYLRSWVMMLKNRDATLNIITYVATGIMMLMIIYSFAVYVQNRSKEFVYYSAYALSTLSVMFLKSFLSFKPSAFTIFFEEYLDFMILCGGVFFYLSFIRKFLNTGTREPFLENMLRYAEITFCILLGIFSYLYFATDKYVVLNILENYVIKLLIFAISFIVIIYSFRKKDPLLNYLAAGNIALVFFMIISLSMIIFKWRLNPANPGSVFNRSMLYYEIGLVLELTMFVFGIAYKNKKDIITQVKERERFKRESERREFEKQMAVMAVRQEERDRISADMHDDLGAGVTAIRLMSEIVKSKMNTEKYPEIDKISNSANELLGKMNAIIWTMKSSNDSIESLVAYLRAYATEYFDGTPVKCTVEVRKVIDREVGGEKRRNIFLSFKETLNNILKHANATHVKIEIQADEKKLLISVHDNGSGIDLKKLRRFGNGLNNIKKRMQSIQGHFLIGNDNGTLVCFELDLDLD